MTARLLTMPSATVEELQNLKWISKYRDAGPNLCAADKDAVANTGAEHDFGGR
jgi:hypothetical protein